MSGFTVEPEKIRDEAKKWFDRAENMNAVRQRTENLYLGISAFFPGGMTEAGHNAKYGELLGAAVHRLNGATIEFELVGMTLRDIASAYEGGELAGMDGFRVTAEQIQRAGETHRSTPRGGGEHRVVPL